VKENIMSDRWIADRMSSIEMSGIRKIFELARDLKNPVNLSIGQPHFPVPDPIKQAAKDAIDANQNGYTVTQGITSLRDKIQNDLAQRLPGQDRAVMITAGTSGGLFLALSATVNPGDEVILFDPYFVAYPHLVTLSGGVPIVLGTYPDFQIDVNKVRDAITPRTKVILFSSPSNPTGTVLAEAVLRDLAALAKEKDILLISDEIYRVFCYDGAFRSIAEFWPDILCVDGFGKAYGMTGWRLGFAHGPRRIIEEMNKLQQFTFVCAPNPVQHAGVVAWDFNTDAIVADYRRKRDFVVDSLKSKFELTVPGGAFYVFPKVPRGTGTEFVQRAIAENLLVIPGGTFSRQDTHIRISYAASDEMLAKGMEILNRIA